MDWQSDSDDYSSADSPALPGTKAIVICDDGVAMERALRVLALLAMEWEFRLDPVVWRFNQLATIPERWYATRDLADADYIILSLSRPDQVARPIVNWLEDLRSEDDSPGVTQLTQQGDNAGWLIEFRDKRGMLMPRVDLPPPSVSRDF